MFIAWRVPRAALFGLSIAILAALTVFPLSYAGAGRVVAHPAPGTLLSPMQEVTFRFPSTARDVTVTPHPDLSGTMTTEGSAVRFKPAEPMRPGAVYRFVVSGRLEDGRQVSGEFSFTIMPLSDELWVYAKLDRIPHEVVVFRGDQPVRRMAASGGRPGDETPEGTFRIQNRGYHFYSQKYGEGAFYWVRIFGNYLFHSIPVDINGRVIQEEAEKLGCPASHGCIRLSFEDAKWFYENVPDGALVVIDRT